MRLIDADELITEVGKIRISSCELSVTLKIWEEIKNANTIDAVPVVHGEWINEEIDVGYNFAEYRYTCSNCGAKTEFGRYPTTKFCQHCGAKMDGERKTE